MQQISTVFYKTQIGEFILGAFNGRLCLLDYRDKHNQQTRDKIDNRLKKRLNAEFIEQDQPVLEAARAQIGEYLNQQRKAFDIPILMVGTDCQQRVWRALMQLAYGTTLSYKQLAVQYSGNEKAARAVAAANAANALSLIVPCHRITGDGGRLRGYGGGLSAQQYLLDLEGGMFR